MTLKYSAFATRENFHSQTSLYKPSTIYQQRSKAVISLILTFLVFFIAVAQRELECAVMGRGGRMESGVLLNKPARLSSISTCRLLKRSARSLEHLHVLYC